MDWLLLQFILMAPLKKDLSLGAKIEVQVLRTQIIAQGTNSKRIETGTRLLLALKKLSTKTFN